MFACLHLLVCRLSDDKDPEGKVTISVGIIDILIEYEGTKHAEHTLKSMIHDGSKISICPPDEYGPRFREFMKAGIQVTKEETLK